MLIRPGRLLRQHAAGVKPVLDLNFLFGFDSRIVFSRSSLASYYDSNGTLQQAANNIPRLDHDPTTHAPKGFLIEPSGTNYLLNSGTPATQAVTLTAGTYTLWLVGSGTAAIAAGTAVGSGWGTASAGSPVTITITTGGTVTVTVAGSLTRFQLENSAGPTSYIATTGTSATRSADSADLLVSSFPFNASAGTIVADVLFVNSASAFNQTQGIAHLDDGTNNNRMWFYQNTTGNINATITISGTSVTSISAGPATIGSVSRAAFAWQASDQAVVYKGGTPEPETQAIPSGIANLRIGRNVSAAMLNGYLQRLRYWPRRLPNSQLQSLTR